MRQDLDERIKDELSSDPLIMVKGLAKKLGVADSTVSKRLTRLERLGEVLAASVFEDGVYIPARLPIPRSRIEIVQKAELLVDFRLRANGTYLSAELISQEAYKGCGLSLFVLTPRAREGYRVSWKWNAKEPSRDLSPLQKVEVRLVDVFQRARITTENGEPVDLQPWLPNDFPILVVTLFDERGKTLRVPYLLFRRGILLKVFQLSLDRGGGKANPLQEPFWVLSSLRSVMGHARKLREEGGDARRCAFSVSLGSLENLDSFLSDIMEQADSASISIREIDALKAQFDVDEPYRYRTVVRIVMGDCIDLLAVDDRIVHSGWTDDYSHFEERVREIAKKHRTHFELIDADLYAEELERCYKEVVGEEKRGRAFDYMAEDAVAALFMLKRLE